ncbi:MAG: 2-oxo acid dehydrogenase subunit E2 [Anaerolineae bacterium]|nr:2-oxo acid dehydrogenase subunit E2 [Anaerolineae bacterium]
MRQLVTDIGWIAKQSDPIIGLLEIDVTEARTRIQAHQAATGVRLSFTAFLVTCVAHAVNEHKHVHAARDWRGRLVIFGDVDVTTMIEIEADGRKTPVGHIIRAANRKTLQDIHDEIRAVQTAQTRSEAAAYVRQLVRIPRSVRRAMIRAMIRMPTLSKKMRGTVVVSAVGMFGKRGGWPVTLPSHSLNVVVGGIVQKPGVVDGQIAIRDYLNLTVAFDHRVVDGAPAARFAVRLQDMIETAYGLPGQ